MRSQDGAIITRGREGFQIHATLRRSRTTGPAGRLSRPYHRPLAGPTRDQKPEAEKRSAALPNRGHGHLGALGPVRERPFAGSLSRLPPYNARDCILAWWRSAYVFDGSALVRRFDDEVQASLPAMPPSGGSPDTDEVYEAISVQRLRLHQDEQVPESGG